LYAVAREGIGLDWRQGKARRTTRRVTRGTTAIVGQLVRPQVCYPGGWRRTVTSKVILNFKKNWRISVLQAAFFFFLKDSLTDLFPF
jgi:hypothetical protein